MPMSTLICLVRHGVTAWNYDGKAQGLSDIPLAPEGLKQAEAVAERLASEPWDAIYSSTLSRAFETARTIARRVGHGEVRTDGRLVERCLGAGEGISFADRKRRFPGLSWDAIPGVEPAAEVVQRTRAALTDIAHSHPGGRVVCVTHGAVIHHLLQSLALPEDGPPRLFHQRNTAVTTFRCDGERIALESPPDFGHILREGIEYSGEKGRVTPGQLATLLDREHVQTDLELLIWSATGIEAAWVEDQLVAFVQATADGDQELRIAMNLARPDYAHVLPDLVRRLEARFPRHKTA